MQVMLPVLGMLLMLVAMFQKMLMYLGLPP